MEIFGIINPGLMGSLIIVWLFPRDSLRKANFIFTIFLGTGLGLGITSSTAFLWLALFGQPNLYYFLSEFGLVLVLFFLAFYSIRSSKDLQGEFTIGSNNDFHTILGLKYLFWALLVFSLASFALKSFIHDPYGKWDAWTIWNFRARWLFHGGSHWSYAFSKDLLYSHPDYPLLLPASVFRMWVITGTDNIVVPIAIAGFFTFGSIFLIQQCLSVIRGPNQSYIAAIFMLTATQYLKVGTYQYADIPLAFFILSTVLLLILKEKYPLAGLRIMFLAGLATSCAAWTKNEGILFSALIILILIVFDLVIKERQGIKNFFFFLCGLTPISSIEFFFKIKFAPKNDIVNLNNLSLISDYLIQLDRYQQIFLKFLKKVFLFNDGIVFLMLVYMLFSGLNKNYFNRGLLLPPVALIGLLLCGYFFSFLISPNDLTWHLNSSLYRLIMHVWPSWVFLFFLCIKGPEKLSIDEKRI